MKGKLIKRDNDFYSLIVDGLVMATSNGMIVDYKLSLKNCEAIERGYDLDELADEESKLLPPTSTELEKLHLRIGFVRGAETILEILGDKKFSEDDIYRAFEEGERQDRTGLYDIIRPTEQTEWDVEIETNQIPADRAPGGWDISPKLDSDGNLILKSI